MNNSTALSLDRRTVQWLLRHDTVSRRAQPHVVHLHKGLAVQTEPVHEGLKMDGEQSHLHHSADHGLHRCEVTVDFVDERCLESVRARVVRQSHLETGLRECGLKTRGGGGSYRTDEGLDTTHEVGMLWVCWVVRGEAHPVDKDELGSRSQNTVDLFEQLAGVLAQTECLYFVETVESVILESSTYPSIVRYLSGRNRYAITRSLLA